MRPVLLLNPGPVYHTEHCVGMYMGMLSGSTGRVNGKTRLSFTILSLSSFLPRQVDGSD